MKQVLRAGGELDILSGEEFGASQTKLIEAILRASKRPSVRVLDQIIQDATAAGRAEIITKGPPTSRVWDIRRITVASETKLEAFATITGIFHYRNAISPANFLDGTTQIPNVSVWEDQQLLLYPGETIITVVVGAGNAESIAVTIQGVDMDRRGIRTD